MQNAVNIEEAFEDEKFDSFKNRAKETLKEAYAVIEDMEGVDRLHQAKAIKEAALKENKRQLVITQQMVYDRLEKLKKSRNQVEEKKRSILYVKLIIAVGIVAASAVFGPALLAFIF